MQASKGIAANEGRKAGAAILQADQAQNIGRMNPENRNYSPSKPIKMIII